VLDRQLFNPARTDVGLPPFDESPEAYYNVIPDALLVNKNMLQLDMRSTGKQAEAGDAAGAGGVTIESRHDADRRRLRKWEDGWKLPEACARTAAIKVVLHGTFPKNCNREQQHQRGRPPGLCGPAVPPKWKRSWAADQRRDHRRRDAAGRPPAGRARLARAAGNRARYQQAVGQPLARTVFLSLGSAGADPVLGSQPLAGGRTETTAVARRRRRAQLDARARHRRHRPGDGKRLRPVAPERISRCRWAACCRPACAATGRRNSRPACRSSRVDGTMRRRLNGSPAAGRARMKTGTLRNVVALAGYVPDATGAAVRGGGDGQQRLGRLSAAKSRGKSRR
jgi:D-alanyl-D-alanine carboxypeptidase/D-alanyl-D-alanine-endopeptidase (penicillin-binding protein 4)